MLLTSYLAGSSQQDYSYSFVLLLLISSIVVADPSRQLNLTDDFNTLTVDDVLTGEDNWRESQKEEIEWRESNEKQTQPSRRREVRWGAQVPYDEDNNLNPIVSPSQNRPSGVVKNPEVAPQFQIRF